ncbi:MAG: hypothetical protein JZU55_12310, partial [Afipia sp.]|nr:hypothetical protein [Afipia sp.]
ILPVRIFGKGGKEDDTIDFSFIFHSASASFGELDGQPIANVILEAVSEDGLSARRGGLPVDVKWAKIELTLNAPTLTLDRKIETNLRSALLRIGIDDGEGGTEVICFCQEVEELTALLSNTPVTIGSMAAERTISFPECLDVRDTKMKARSAEWAPYTCSDGKLEGRMASSDRPGPTTLRIGDTLVGPRMHKGVLYYGVPYEIISE